MCLGLRLVMPVTKVSYLSVLRQGHAQVLMELLEFGVETRQLVKVR